MKSETLIEFRIEELLGIGMTLVVLGIGLAYGLQVMGDVADDMGDNACTGYWNSTSNTCQVNSTDQTALSANPTHYNATTDAIEGVSKIPEKLPTIATVIVAAVILGILVTYLWARFR